MKSMLDSYISTRFFFSLVPRETVKCWLNLIALTTLKVPNDIPATLMHEVF